jgi:hypothetical protein
MSGARAKHAVTQKEQQPRWRENKFSETLFEGYVWVMWWRAARVMV